jgi:hypothetical protein
VGCKSQKKKKKKQYIVYMYTSGSSEVADCVDQRAIYAGIFVLEPLDG